MKTLFKNLFILALFLGGIVAMFPYRMSAQTLTVLHTFTNTPDGNSPRAAFILAGNVLYGTTVEGGLNGAGMVFRMNTDGTDFTNLHSFALTGSFFTNTGGAYPSGPLLLSTNMLYGLTFMAGPVAMAWCMRWTQEA
jgi:uncharacterized repeat protein (TIGR03803 family)